MIVLLGQAVELSLRPDLTPIHIPKLTALFAERRAGPGLRSAGPAPFEL